MDNTEQTSASKSRGWSVYIFSAVLLVVVGIIYFVTKGPSPSGPPSDPPSGPPSGPKPAPKPAPSLCNYTSGVVPSSIDKSCWLGYSAASKRLLKGDKFYLRGKLPTHTVWRYWRYSKGGSCKNFGTYDGHDDIYNTFSFKACDASTPSLDRGLLYTQLNGCCKNDGKKGKYITIPKNQCLVYCESETCSNENPSGYPCETADDGSEDWANLAIVSPPIGTGNDFLRIAQVAQVAGNTPFLYEGTGSTAWIEASPVAASYTFQVAFAAASPEESYIPTYYDPDIPTYYDPDEFTGRF
tara:strand:+ start:1504 stop:2394 length:891 start_codon:yes stop_codon:yes gene_type:complete